MKKTLVIVLGSIGTGGVEVHVARMVELYKINGWRIIWLHSRNCYIADGFKGIMNGPAVERVVCERGSLNFKLEEELHFAHDEHVVVLTWILWDFICALGMKKKYPDVDMRCFFCINNFRGMAFFYEGMLFCNEIVRRGCAFLYKHWIENGLVLYYAKSHYEAVENQYGIKIRDVFKRLVPNCTTNFKLSEDDIRRRFENNKFLIVAAGRSDFPHKGFIIGLIKTFNRLCLEYPQLELKVIGFEKNAALNDVLNNCTPEVLGKIEFLGNMPIEDLKSYYNRCNLCVAVAGCAYCACQVGLPTLPARHYSYSCEVYGFWPESLNYMTSDLPGQPLEQYAEKVLNMNYDEYLQLSWNIYKLSEKKVDDIDYFLNLAEVNTDYNLNYKEKIVIFVLDLFCKVNSKIKNILGLKD